MIQTENRIDSVSFIKYSANTTRSNSLLPLVEPFKFIEMSRSQEIGGKILKYAEEKIQKRSVETTARIRKYVSDLSEVSKELMYSSALRASKSALIMKK